MSEGLFDMEERALQIGDPVTVELPWGDESGTLVLLFRDKDGHPYAGVKLASGRTVDVLVGRLRT